MRRRLYSWRNSHISPFLHRPRNQCLQTRLVQLLAGASMLAADAYTYLLYDEDTWCLSGQRLPRGQWPCIYALHCGRSGSKPKRYSRRRKSLKLKSYVVFAVCAIAWSGGVALGASAIVELSYRARLTAGVDACNQLFRQR
jgi:hypothetical protein